MLGKKKITLAYPDERLQLKDSLMYIQSFAIDRPQPARSKAFTIINFTGVRSNYGGRTPQVSHLNRKIMQTLSTLSENRI